MNPPCVAGKDLGKAEWTGTYDACQAGLAPGGKGCCPEVTLQVSVLARLQAGDRARHSGLGSGLSPLLTATLWWAETQ